MASNTLVAKRDFVCKLITCFAVCFHVRSVRFIFSLSHPELCMCDVFQKCSVAPSRLLYSNTSISMCITTFEYTVCTSTHSVVSRICVFAFESMANIYISLVNRWEKNDFWLNLKLTLRSQQNASFVIFELWYLWQLLHLNFFQL